MIEEIKKEIERKHLCSRNIIENAVIDVVCNLYEIGHKKYDSEVEELFTGELFGYKILCTILKDVKTKKLIFPILKIEPVGKVQKFYEELIHEGYDAIIYYTGESIFLSPRMKSSESPIAEICKQNNFYISMEVSHPERKDEICWKITPFDK